MNNQLEEFIKALNVIQTDNSRYEHLAEYLLEGKGWSVLAAIYTKKIKVTAPILF
jgi:hypothetical protein